MPSRSSAFLWLVNKECRELLASRSWWVLFFAIGPLAGVSFISSVRTYAEVSGLNGTSAGVGEALSPLTGVWAPTFSACELAAVFLLPFVAIRLVAGDRQSGALRLEIQQPMSSFARMLTKALVLLAGWLIAMLPPFSALLLWKSYGGHVFVPELITLTLGHVLNAGLAIGLAAAMCSIAEHPSTAAILTLSLTVGTWIVNFFGAIQGGLWERAAAYTPAAMVADFQHGLVRLDTLLISVLLSLTGLALAAIWLRLGIDVHRRAKESAAIFALAAVGIVACTFLRASWDTSQARTNSLPRADEQAVRQIRQPLRIEAHLAPEDPRRADLEHQALSKLRRVMPNLQVSYVAGTSTGLFEQTREGYGEIWYDLGGRKTMSRVTTAEGVLESIYSLSGVTPPSENDADIFRGQPLAVPPKWAGTVFYIFWPCLVVLSRILIRRELQ